MSVSSPSRQAWSWRALAEPREPRAAVGVGPASARLLARVASADEARREGWTIAASDDLLVVLGAGLSLPWADGVAYAAPHPQAPALWLPTTEEPDVPMDLLAAALARAHGRAPLLLWPSPSRVWPLDLQQPARAEVLEAVTARWQRRGGAA